MTATKEWTRQDLWLGLLFLGMGILIVLFVVGAMKNGYSAFFWGTGCFLAPVFLLLGGNAVYRSLRAGPPERSEE